MCDSCFVLFDFVTSGIGFILYTCHSSAASSRHTNGVGVGAGGGTELAAELESEFESICARIRSAPLLSSVGVVWLIGWLNHWLVSVPLDSLVPPIGAKREQQRSRVISREYRHACHCCCWRCCVVLCWSDNPVWRRVGESTEPSRAEPRTETAAAELS